MTGGKFAFILDSNYMLKPVSSELPVVGFITPLLLLVHFFSFLDLSFSDLVIYPVWLFAFMCYLGSVKKFTFRMLFKSFIYAVFSTVCCGVLYYLICIH